MDFELTLTIECYCGRKLQANQLSDTKIEVEPCENCLSKKYDEGFRKGQDE